jgi:hypothetical protein
VNVDFRDIKNIKKALLELCHTMSCYVVVTKKCQKFESQHPNMSDQHQRWFAAQRAQRQEELERVAEAERRAKIQSAVPV